MRIKWEEWPRNTSTRVRSGFLWFPKEIEMETRWLERATWVEECVHYIYVRTGKKASYKWEPIRWDE
jgi:hypothetical protein